MRRDWFVSNEGGSEEGVRVSLIVLDGGDVLVEAIKRGRSYAKIQKRNLLLVQSTSN